MRKSSSQREGVAYNNSQYETSLLPEEMYNAEFKLTNLKRKKKSRILLIK